MEPYQFSLAATVWGATPPGGGAPDPGLVARLKGFLNAAKNNVYVKVATYSYAAYRLYSDGQFPGRPGMTQAEDAGTRETVRAFLEEQVGYVPNQREMLDRVFAWVKRTEDVAIPGYDDTIVTYMGQQWLVDP